MGLTRERDITRSNRPWVARCEGQVNCDWTRERANARLIRSGPRSLDSPWEIMVNTYMNRYTLSESFCVHSLSAWVPSTGSTKWTGSYALESRDRFTWVSYLCSGRRHEVVAGRALKTFRTLEVLDVMRAGWAATTARLRSSCCFHVCTLPRVSIHEENSRCIYQLTQTVCIYICCRIRLGNNVGALKLQSSRQTLEFQSCVGYLNNSSIPYNSRVLFLSSSDKSLVSFVHGF